MPVAVEKKMKTILVVDDEYESLSTYREILTDMGYKVITEPDGGSALLAVCDREEIDLVITDYRMPGMNGMELVSAVRAIKPRIPVIMITAYANIENYLESREEGIFEFVNKPISKSEFERIVRIALARAKGGISPIGEEAS